MSLAIDPGVLALIAVSLPVVLLLLWQLPKRQLESWRSRSRSIDRPYDLENSFRVTLVQLFGGLFVLLGLAVTYSQLLTTNTQLRDNQKTTATQIALTRESQIADRFNRAVDQLGSDSTSGAPRLDVRLGGIYELLRIAQNRQDTSDDDRETVLNMLINYVRQNSPIRAPQTGAGVSGPYTDQNPNGGYGPYATPDPPVLEDRGTYFDPPASQLVFKQTDQYQHEYFTQLGPQCRGNVTPRVDIAAVIRILGTDTWTPDEKTAPSVVWNLAAVDLRGGNLVQAHLQNLTLRGSDLRQAQLNGAVLDDSNLNSAHLEGACLQATSLYGAHLEGAHLQGAILFGAQFTRIAPETGTCTDGTRARMDNAEIAGVALSGVDMRCVLGLTHEQWTSAFTNGACEPLDWADGAPADKSNRSTACP